MAVVEALHGVIVSQARASAQGNIARWRMFFEAGVGDSDAMSLPLNLTAGWCPRN